MTREEAIKILRDTPIDIRSTREDDIHTLYATAQGMAIEALTEPKTIVGIDIPYGSDKGIATLFKGKDDKMALEEVKEIMAVVRCKDCKRQKTCKFAQWQGNYGYCSNGEKREK